MLIKIAKWSGLAILIFACIASKGCSDPIKTVLKGPNGAVLTTTKGDQSTSTGVRVKYGATPLNDAQLKDVSDGIARAIENGKKSGYTDTRSAVPSFFLVQTPPYVCPLSPEQKIPSFLLHADQYDGTEYDQYNPKGAGVKDGRGVIYAAEMVLSVGTIPSSPDYGWMYVCISDDHETNANAVNNGAEHIVIANNDSDYFFLTQYHGTYSHPLLPKIVTNNAHGPSNIFTDSSIELVNVFGNSVEVLTPNGIILVEPTK
jgi:hypothetical protein